eukprot:CAMPEP_0196802372 /NCGR_PEP_ID=MMETSP1362-20130617/1990_1 /TAXON_ID=163516 /ORGANISM="Leptocylindrus danicus, Strain CCMP1856" /LENGTH=38 /DNA_ID= /DNA_START= /DNA_END= /DNA_ORIENTATION=
MERATSGWSGFCSSTNGSSSKPASSSSNPFGSTAATNA